MIRNWQGGGGLRAFWETLGRGIALFPAGDEGCFMDADTPADYLRLQERRKIRRNLPSANPGKRLHSPGDRQL